MEIHWGIHSANFDLLNTYFGIDVGNIYDLPRHQVTIYDIFMNFFPFAFLLPYTCFFFVTFRVILSFRALFDQNGHTV